MPYGEGWLEKGIQFGGLFINYILFGKPPIPYDKTVPYGTLNKNKTVPYGINPIILGYKDKTVPYGTLNKNKTVPYGTLEENTNG